MTERQKKKMKESVAEKIKNKFADNLRRCWIEGKGHGIKATDTLHHGEFVCEYAGEFLDPKETEERERKYNRKPRGKPRVGSWMLWFMTEGHTEYCSIDATEDDGRMGRFINHPKEANLRVRVHKTEQHPRVYFTAKECIYRNQELLYPYGIRNKKSLGENAFLNDKERKLPVKLCEECKYKKKKIYK